MTTTIGFASYGHTDPANPDRPRNAMLLVNWGLLQGLNQFANARKWKLIDFSPPLKNGGIDQAAHADLSRLEPVDVLLFQGGVSRHVVEAMRWLNPRCVFVEQRESTHATTYLRLMKDAQRRHGIEWRIGYEGPQLQSDLAEYDAAKRILVPSGFVAESFAENGLKDKVLYYGPTLVEPWDAKLSRRPFPFTVLHAAQLGIRKGTLDVFEGWRRFRRACPNRSSVLIVAGLPEHGAPPELAKRIKHEFRMTPDVECVGWIDRDRLRAAYARAHVVLMPSIEDGATMVGYEAGYAGCAIVSTYNAGIDLPRLDVAPHAPEEIAEALASFSDPRKMSRWRFAERARGEAVRLCSPEAYAERVSRALEDALP